MNDEPTWIEREDCLALHEQSISLFGGSTGIRDEPLMESALCRPKQRFSYESADFFALAASLACGIVKNHPFIDGNKRTGFLCAALFLEVNGLSFNAPEEEVVERTLALAAGAIGETEYGEWLGRSSVARD